MVTGPMVSPTPSGVCSSAFGPSGAAGPAPVAAAGVEAAVVSGDAGAVVALASGVSVAGAPAAAAPVFTPSTSIIPKIAPTQSAFL